MKATQDMCERYGISTVYVSSDSEAAVREFEEALPGLEVLKWDVNRQFMESNTQRCGATEFSTRGTGLGVQVIRLSKHLMFAASMLMLSFSPV